MGAVVEQPDDVRQRAPSECRVAANVGRADDEARATIDRSRRQHGRRAAITSPSATRRPVASRASVERNRVRVLRTRWTATPPRPSRCVAGNSSEAHRITAEVVRLLAGQWRGIGQSAWRALHGASATPARWCKPPHHAQPRLFRLDAVEPSDGRECPACTFPSSVSTFRGARSADRTAPR